MSSPIDATFRLKLLVPHKQMKQNLNERIISQPPSHCYILGNNFFF